MSKFCYGGVATGVEARAWHFPSLGRPKPDSLPSGTGLAYPVVPPHPIHPFLRWALAPAPTPLPGQTLSQYSLCCWSSLGNQLPEELGTLVTIGTGTGSTEHPSITKGPRPSPLPTPTLPPLSVSTCHLTVPPLTTSLFALLPILSKMCSFHPLGIPGI